MIWADRVAVVWGLVLAGFVLAVFPHDATAAQLCFWGSITPWLLLRGLDWIGTGQFWRTH